MTPVLPAWADRYLAAARFRLKQGIVLAAVWAMAGTPAPAATFKPDVRPGPGCWRTGRVSDYFPALQGTAMDTRVYFLKGGLPGPTVLVLGGTHANEPAGSVAAQILVEHGAVARGRLIVVVHANPSAASIRDTRCGIPHCHKLPGSRGPRVLPYGDRLSDPADHKGRGLAPDLRNLNRVWPGNAKGTPTEQLACGLFTLIQQEKPLFMVDFHEARTCGPGRDLDRPVLANSLVAPAQGLEPGALALLDMADDTGIALKLEASGPACRGMSHWEVSTRTRTLAFLTESPNPGQDEWRAAPDVIQDPELPLRHRVGIHLRMLVHLASAVQAPGGGHLVLENIPAYRELMEKGVGWFLN